MLPLDSKAFFSADFSILLDFQSDGQLNGEFTIRRPRRRISFEGLWIVEQRTLKVAFIIDWVNPAACGNLFTAFSGEIDLEKQHKYVMSLEWMRVNRADDDGIAGNLGGICTLCDAPRASKVRSEEVVPPYPIQEEYAP